MIDAHKSRNTVVFDIPGTYLNSNTPKGKTVFLKLEGKFVDIMYYFNRELKEYVRYEKSRKVIYMSLHKAIYGCIESVIMWYDLYNNTLKGMDFKLNPYNIYVANNMVNGE